MRDFNFFEPYLENKKNSRYTKFTVYSLVSILVLGLIIYPLINIFKINSLGKEIAAMKVNLESNDTYERLNIVEEKIQQTKQIETELELLKNTDQILKDKDIVNDLLLKTIINRVPMDVFFQSISLLPTQIQIQGSAINNIAIAQFETNLREIDDFDEIFIPNIWLDEGLYHFSITFTIKGEKQNEVNE